jgi:peptidoglycan/xylan/chitin deacetylase (PgdA/CDA1 family)
MLLQHQLLIISRPLQLMLRKICCKLGVVSPNRLRVLLYHDIQEDQEESFYEQLNWLKREWNFVTPDQFEKMILGEMPIKGNNLLLTFDDGMLSNLAIAENILNKLDIKAIFFVISEFIKIKDTFKVKQFVSKYILDGFNINNCPKTWSNLQSTDLKKLIKQGHTIGSHTKTHKRLSNCNSKSELEEEIIMSAKNIELILGIEIKHFAYTFGDIDSFSKDALLIAKSKFSFIYSGLRGDNSKLTSPFAIRRDAASIQSPVEYKILNNKLLGAFLDGFSDFHYKSSREKIDFWTK